MDCNVMHTVASLQWFLIENVISMLLS